MNAAVAVQILNVFVLLLLAFRVQGADDAAKGSIKNLNPPPQAGSDNDDSSEPKPSIPPKASTPVPRSLIEKIKARPHQPMPTLPLIEMYATNSQNVTCILVKAGIRFTFNYRNATSKLMVNQSIVDVPVHNFTVDGLCNPNRQSISIIFFPDVDLKWNLTFEFARNTSAQHLAYSEKIRLDYSLRTGSSPFPWAKTQSATAVYSTPGFFSLTLGSSYICLQNSRVSNFSESVDSQVKEMRLYGLQMQAFRTEKNNTVFSTVIVQCSGDAVSSTVPLFVGLFILTLIVTVLIVFILRRRMMDRKEAHKKLATEEGD
jgi:hypothetical protein